MFIYVVLHTGVRLSACRSLTGEAGIFRSCRWVSYLSGRADRERAARERCEEADESCPASPRRENAWEDDRAENCTEKNNNRGLICHEIHSHLHFYLIMYSRSHGHMIESCVLIGEQTNISQ